MRFIFETEHLDEKLYKRAFMKIQLSNLPWRKKRKYLKDHKNYVVIIRPMERASEDRFFHGKDGVGGVTDFEKMVLYLEDKHENPKDPVQRVFRKNCVVISHEGGHDLLMWEGRGEKTPLRNDDEMGHRAGTKLNFWTAEVHDRDIENFTRWISLFKWYKPRWYRYQIKIIDFRDLLK